jgi:hypothetical protein
MDISHVIAELLKNSEKQRGRLHDFSQSYHGVATDFYRTEGYVRQCQAILHRLETLAGMYRKAKKDILKRKANPKDYAELVNHIVVEYQLLLATDRAMKENIERLKKDTGIVHQISGKMLHMQKGREKMVRRLEEALRDA